MTPTGHDRRVNRRVAIAYNLRFFWYRLGWSGQILIAAVLWAMFVLVAFPRLGDLIEHAVWGTP